MALIWQGAGGSIEGDNMNEAEHSMPDHVTLTESEALALLELMEDKGLTEFRHTEPELERVFDKLDALRAEFKGRHP